ncbi:hypothetical protein AJ80_01716 [Polytolypa hystricis UAMH7299]|uniref:Carboxylic ester hydrolase n=1 Tax=Polytolypa hystricis (strain UAMH7299) TaxID=1447883 RepID=A0A2B7Z183_POLH7|nr:hypothetical protein AJ80_01716 [Polytolypa hystricis UAMH7299]
MTSHGLVSRLLFLLSCLILATDAIPCIHRKRDAASVVEAPAGTFSGTTSRYRDDVVAYLGIPYARAPAGNLRFAAPRRLDKLDGVFDASEFGPDCPANKPVVIGNMTTPAGTKILQALSQQDTPISEDCLTLSIWAKNNDETGKPVIIWIYGGGYATGSVSIPLYDGSYFASDEDVIFVAISYRLNIFGFPGAPGLPHQNLGLRDIRLGVEWVRDNIAAFGGDPERMVLQGESAGAGAVDMWAYAYKDDPIVKALIAQSGAVSVAAAGGGEPGSSWYNVSEQLGCGGQSAGDETIECMRGKSVDELLSITAGFGGVGGVTFFPQADNITVFSDYGDRGESGNFAQLPLLNGNNDYEQGFYEISAPDTPDIILRAIGLSFTCGSRSASDYRADNDAPVWRYRYYGEFPNTRLFDGSGAYHTSEIFTLFGTAEPVTGVKNTPEQEAIGDNIRHAWAAFARDPVNGLTQLGWPQWKARTRSLIRLGYENNPQATFTFGAVTDGLCRLFDGLSGVGLGGLIG